MAKSAIISVAVAAILQVLGTAQPATAAPALWEVSDADSKIWLFGSFHLLPPDLKWRTQVFDRTLQSATHIYFETDVGDAAQGALLGETFRLGINPVGVRLTDSLNAAQASTLTQTTTAAGIDLGSLQAMRPWLATITIAVAATVEAGYDPRSGVDMQLQREIPQERQRYFESTSEQLGFLANAPQAEQTAQLIDTINQLDQLKTSMAAMLDAWSTGKPETLSTLFTADLGGDRAFSDRLIHDRNANWVKTLKTLLASNQQDLIVVGAGHLLGDRSVVDLLRKGGFTVTRLQ